MFANRDDGGKLARASMETSGVAGMDLSGLCRASWRDREIPGTTITCDINLLAFGQVNFETRIINSWW
jgi:hypothetical protein